MKSKLRLVLRIFPWLVLSLILVWLVAFHGLDDGFKGSKYRQARKLFHLDGENITRVEIRLLSVPPEERDKMTPPRTISLENEELEAFRQVWSLRPDCEGSGAMCHEPAYGFRLFQSGGEWADTTICWQCMNFTVRAPWPFGERLVQFDSHSPAALKLLEFCDQRLPYYRPPPPPARAPKPANPASSSS